MGYLITDVTNSRYHDQEAQLMVLLSRKYFLMDVAMSHWPRRALEL